MDEKNYFHVPEKYLNKIRSILQILYKNYSESNTIESFEKNWERYNIDWDENLQDQISYSFNQIPNNLDDLFENKNTKILDTSLIRNNDTNISLKKMRDKLQLYFDDDISDRDKLLDTFEYRTVRIGDKRSLGINKLLELYLEMYK